MRACICISVLLLITGLLETFTTSEASEVSSKTTNTNDDDIEPTPKAEKPKRGAENFSNSSSNLLSQSASSSAGSAGEGFKGSIYRSLQPVKQQQASQYHKISPHLTYYQSGSPGTQIAAQYSYQGVPILHFLRTPTHFQFVTTPSVQIPFHKNPSTKNTAPDTSSATTINQHPSPPQPIASPQPGSHLSSGYVPQPLLSPASYSKLIPTTYPSQQQFYYPHQPYLTVFLQPQSIVHPFDQTSAAYFRQQNPFFYTGNNLAAYNVFQNQVPYFFPVRAPQVVPLSTEANEKTPKFKAAPQQQHQSSAPVQFFRRL